MSSMGLPGMGGDFAKGVSGSSSVYDTSPTGLGLSPAYLAAGATASASSTAGTSLLAHTTRTTSVSTVGTTFGTGADIFAAALSFTADGTSDYLVQIVADEILNSGAGNITQININLDTADAGIMAVFKAAAATQGVPLCAAGVIVAPAAGAHTVNLRLSVSGGTGQVVGGGGGAGVDLPILAKIEKLA